MTATSCRWPMGDPRHPTFRFCGEAVVPTRCYCADHSRRAGQSGAPRPLTSMGRVARPFSLPVEA